MKESSTTSSIGDAAGPSVGAAGGGLHAGAARSRARGVDQQGDPAVAEDRGAEIARHRVEERAQGLDDDLRLSDQAIAGERRPAAARAHDDRGRAGRERGSLGAEQLGEVAERDRCAAQLERPAASQRERLRHRDRLLHAREREAEDVRAPLDEQDVEQRERERQEQRDAHARAGLALDLHLPAKLSTCALTASNPTPRPARSLTAARVENPGRARTSTSEPSSAARASSSAETPRPSSETVTATLRPRCSAASTTCPRWRLPGRTPLRRRLDAVGDGIAQHVHERLREPFEDHAVEFRLRPLDDEIDLLALGVRAVANGARERPGDRSERQRAGLERGVLQGVEQAVAEIELVREILSLRGVARGDHVAQPLAVEHRLADQAEQDVELLGRDAHRAAARALALRCRISPVCGGRSLGGGPGRRLPFDESQWRCFRHGLRLARAGGVARGRGLGGELRDEGDCGLGVHRVAVDERADGIARAQQRIGEHRAAARRSGAHRRARPRRRARARRSRRARACPRRP